jgi:hypothetical protein
MALATGRCGFRYGFRWLFFFFGSPSANGGGSAQRQTHDGASRQRSGSGHKIGAMAAFIKRRWLLLLLVANILLCSFVTLVRTHGTGTYGIIGGNFHYLDLGTNVNVAPSPGLHAPTFGSLPEFRSAGRIWAVFIPVWCPLIVVVAFIAFLEWRRKRAASRQ